MSVYLIWVGLIVLTLTIYSIFVWKRSAKTFRFQARLTILFLLFILIPSVPLTLFLSSFLTENTEFLLLPGIETSLEESQETIRRLVKERADIFFKRNPDILTISPNDLEENQISFVGIVGRQQNRLVKLKIVNLFPDSVNMFFPDINVEDFEAIKTGEIQSSMRRYNNQYYFEAYNPINDSTVLIAGYWIDNAVVETKDKISSLLRIYKFKERIVDPNLIWAFATAFILLLALLAVAAARKFSRGISEPIQELVSGMRKVAEGDLKQQVEAEAKDEIAILVDSFNRMTRDLRVNREKLIQTERIAAWRDIARRVSHEIKNPLTPIQIALYRIRTQIKVPEAEKEKFELALLSINEELESLRRLADEFSQFARLPQPEKTLQNLNDIIRSFMILFEADTQKVRFKLELEDDLPQVAIDREQIKRVINNLLKNGVEASPDGGLITIRTSRISDETGNIKLLIQDRGEGISDEVIGKIFDPYYTTKKDGMGLGMAIVKRIINDHDGEISISSQLGIGTTVEILL